ARVPGRVPGSGHRVAGSKNEERGEPKEPATRNPVPETQTLLDQLSAIESTRRDGILTLPDGAKLNVTNLHKVFWPTQKLTKGDLFRYYVQAAPYLLPAVADRPLVMKRSPNGVDGKWFYQHRVDDAPTGVRRERVRVAESRDQIVGGSLLTLLYMTQLAAISPGPWFSRVQPPQFAHYAAPGPGSSHRVPVPNVLRLP